MGSDGEMAMLSLGLKLGLSMLMCRGSSYLKVFKLYFYNVRGFDCWALSFMFYLKIFVKAGTFLTIFRYD